MGFESRRCCVDFSRKNELIFPRLGSCRWEALSVCTQRGERLKALFAIKLIAKKKDGTEGLTEENLLCDHGSDVVARCPRRKAPLLTLEIRVMNKKRKRGWPGLREQNL